MEERKNSKFYNILSRVVFTAAGAIAELYAVSLLLNKPLPIKFILLFLFLVIPIYGLDFLREYKHQITSWQRHLLNAIIIMIFLAFSYILFSINNFWVLVISVLLMLLGILYDPYFKSLTKTIVGFKDFFVIFCFDLFLLVYLLWAEPGTAAVLTILTFAITRDFVNITYCDIKDIGPDKQKGLATFATTMGINKLLMTHALISVASIIILIIGIEMNAISLLGYLLIVPVIVTSVLIFRSHKRRSYSPTNVDFEYFVWLSAIILGKLFI